MVFPAFLAGTNALFIGMVGSRLAFGLSALILVWSVDFIERGDARYAYLAAIALALAILAHPYHIIGILLGLGFYILLRRLHRLTGITRLAGIVAIALGLDAFWVFPLIAHSSVAMVPVIRSTFDQMLAVLTDSTLIPYALLAFPAFLRVRRERDDKRRVMLVVLILLAILLPVLMIADHQILIERLNVYQLDPVRLIGEFYFALIWLAAIGVSELAAWAPWAFRIQNTPRWSAVAAILVGALFTLPFLQSTAYYHSKVNDEPRWLDQAISDYRLQEFWDVLRETPGRVMFTSFYTRLNAHSTDPLPTTLSALTPLFTQRQLIGGTFTEWSPIAALTWVGRINPPVLWGLSEEQDDRALLGAPLEKLSDEQFAALCRRLNITAIVASINDVRTRTFLDASPRLRSYYNNGFFFVYRLKDSAGEWLDAQNATVDVVDMQDDRMVLRVRVAQENASIRVKVYAYPLWQAQTEKGQTLAITPDETALMQIALPRGEDYTVTLRYAEGVIEKLGNWVSVISGGLLIIVALVARIKRSNSVGHLI